MLRVTADGNLHDSNFWEEDSLGDAPAAVVRPVDPNMDPNHDPNQIDWVCPMLCARCVCVWFVVVCLSLCVVCGP